MHSNVPCILQMPSMKQMAHSRGRKVTRVASRLHISAPVAAAVSRVLLVKRNFMRNSSGK